MTPPWDLREPAAGAAAIAGIIPISRADALLKPREINRLAERAMREKLDA
jgi:hypothetical protein